MTPQVHGQDESENLGDEFSLSSLHGSRLTTASLCRIDMLYWMKRNRAGPNLSLQRMIQSASTLTTIQRRLTQQEAVRFSDCCRLPGPWQDDLQSEEPLSERDLPTEE